VSNLCIPCHASCGARSDGEQFSPLCLNDCPWRSLRYSFQIEESLDMLEKIASDCGFGSIQR
jgi:hypothetical protein